MHLTRLKWVTAFALAVVVAGAGVAAVVPRALAAADDAAKVEAERKKLQGTWVAVSSSTRSADRGTPAPLKMKIRLGSACSSASRVARTALTANRAARSESPFVWRMNGSVRSTPSSARATCSWPVLDVSTVISCRSLSASTSPAQRSS